MRGVKTLAVEDVAQPRFGQRFAADRGLAVHLKQRRRGHGRRQSGAQREHEQAQTIGDDQQRNHKDQRHREQPAATLPEHGQLQAEGREHEAGDAQGRGAAAPTGERDGDERGHHEEGRVGVVVAERIHQASVEIERARVG